MSSRPLLRPLCDPYPILLEKSELYLAVVNRWAAREGHERLVQEKVGIGKLAAIVGLAARSLLPDTPTHSLETLQRKSGLSPLAFKTALDHLQAAIDDHNQRQLPPRTPRKDYRSLSSPSHSHYHSSPRTPKPNAVRGGGESGRGGSGSGLSLKEKAKAVQSGAAFGLVGGPSPRTPQSHRSNPSGISSPFRSPAHRGDGNDAALPSPSTSRLRGVVTSATPSSRLPQTAQATATPDGQPRTSTPKSVRFEPSVGRTGRNFGEAEGEEVDRTPSKRRRLSKALREDDDGEGSASIFPSSGRSFGNEGDEAGSAAVRKPKRRAGQSIQAEGRKPISEIDAHLPFVVFPLSAVVRRDREDLQKRTAKNHEVISRWLDLWKDWLDERDDRSDDVAIDQD